MLDFNTSIRILNNALTEKEPKTISPSWVYLNTPNVYRYIWKNIRTETGDIDWDRVTVRLEKTFQKRWIRYRYKQIKLYSKTEEVDIVLNKYKDKLYTFISTATNEDKKMQDKLVISLVRLGQKGNISAQQELIKWISYLIDDWIDRYPQIYKWRGYREELENKIKSCIRCYRYTGSFLGYLFRTLEYSAREKPPLCSLDDPVLDGKRTRIDYIVAEKL